LRAIAAGAAPAAPVGVALVIALVVATAAAPGTASVVSSHPLKNPFYFL